MSNDLVKRLHRVSGWLFDTGQIGYELDTVKEAADRIEKLEEEVARARSTSNYWKTEHIEGNKLIERLQSDLDLVYEYDSNLIDVLKSRKDNK